ncbi:MAG: hypothetical protein HZA53_01295 [Planctomycetes bacterium]|nr:hypothetical protein [Planctomycetota bacterium]
MNSGSHLLTAAIMLSVLVACQSPKEPKEPTAQREQATTSVTLGRRSEGVNAVPTGERGLYRINVGMEQIEQVRVVPQKGDGAESRLVEPGHWTFDRSNGRLRVDVQVDDTGETVIVLGTRARPPHIMLPEKVDFGSVRVLVGDRLGAEGQDYTIDRNSGSLKLLGPDTPENPLRYYVQATMVSDPAHPERARVVAFGNLDQKTIGRLLEIEPH